MMVGEVEVLPARGALDWEAVEKDWRAGVKTKLQMSVEHGVSRAAMDKHFAKLGITRDLSAKIACEAQRLVARQALKQEEKEITKQTPRKKRVAQVTQVTPASKVTITPTQVTQERLDDTEDEIVAANAQLQAAVILSQRKNIRKYSDLAQKMMAELEGTTDLLADFAQLGELLYAPDEKGVDKLNDIYTKVIALPGRVNDLKKLSDVLKTLIGLERQAFGLSDNSNGDADKPPAPSNKELDNDAARRIAFVLLKAERGIP